jgi:hypothetical protein
MYGFNPFYQTSISLLNDSSTSAEHEIFHEHSFLYCLCADN